MSVDLVITTIIGLAAALYVGRMARNTIKHLTATSRGQSACGGCSGCGSAGAPAESEDSCGRRKSKLVELGKKTSCH